MTIPELHQLFLESEGITTDTRNLKKGAIFFALKGASFNGNEFAQQAVDSGCTYAVVDEATFANFDKAILVDNVLLTLQKLANYHRKKFDIPVIGITGSNGKTTTKELAGAVLSKKYNTLVTQGNLNNHLGVPFTLLRMNDTHEIAIIEMGANKPGDIKELAEIAEPTHGMISNIGAAHIEGFGSLEGVVKTKTELYRFIGAHEAHIFVNAEDEVLKENLPSNTTLFSYGEKKGNVLGELVKQDPFVHFKWSCDDYQSPVLTTNLVGKYNFTNFLSAIAFGVYFQVEKESINEAIENYTPSNNRSQVTKTERNTLVVDCYNANATSMMAALESFAEMQAESKLAILGDMLELGDISETEHQKIIDFVQDKKMNAILVGTEMSKVKTGLKRYAKWQDVVEGEKLEDLKGQVILLKGSRGIKLEELIQFI